MELEAMDWDMPQVIAEQPGLEKEYRKRLNKLRVGDML